MGGDRRGCGARRSDRGRAAAPARRHEAAAERVDPEVASFDADNDPWDKPWIAAEADASLPARAGHVRFGLGLGRLGFQLDTNAIAEGSAARVRLRLRVDGGVGRLVLKLPDVKLAPHFDKGEVRFDYVVPILEERF